MPIRDDQPRRGRFKGRPRASKEKLGYPNEWRAMAQKILAAGPTCEACGKRPARHVDHIVSIRAGGTNDRSNLQCLCHPCHSRKTNAVDGGGLGRCHDEVRRRRQQAYREARERAKRGG